MESVYDSFVETAKHNIPGDLRQFVSENYLIVIPIILVLLVSLLSALHKIAAKYTSFLWKHVNKIIGAISSWVIYLFSLDLLIRFDNIRNDVPLKDIFMDSYTIRSLLSIFTLFIMTIYFFGFITSKKYGTSLVVCFSTYISATYCFFCGVKYSDNWLFSVSIILGIAASEFAVRLHYPRSSLLLFVTNSVMFPLWFNLILPVGVHALQTLLSVGSLFISVKDLFVKLILFLYADIWLPVVSGVHGISNLVWKKLVVVGAFLKTHILALIELLGKMAYSLVHYTHNLLLSLRPLMNIFTDIFMALYQVIVDVYTAVSVLLVLIAEKYNIVYAAFIDVYAVGVIRVQMAIEQSLHMFFLEVVMQLYFGLVIVYKNSIKLCCYFFECLVWMLEGAWLFTMTIFDRLYKLTRALWCCIYQYMLVPLYEALLGIYDLLQRGFSLLWSGLKRLFVFVYKIVSWLYMKLLLFINVLNDYVLESIRRALNLLRSAAVEAAMWIYSKLMILVRQLFRAIIYIFESMYSILMFIREHLVHNILSFIWKWGIALVVIVFGILFTRNGYNYYQSNRVDMALVGYILGAYINFVVFLLLTSPYIPVRELREPMVNCSKVLYNYLGFGIPTLVCRIVQNIWNFTFTLIFQFVGLIQNFGQNLVKVVFQIADLTKALIFRPLYLLLSQVWNNPMFSFIASCLSLVGMYYLWRYNTIKLVMAFGSSAYIALSEWFVSIQHSSVGKHLIAAWEFIYNKKFMELWAHARPQLTNVLVTTSAWSATALNSSLFSLANNYFFGYGKLIDISPTTVAHSLIQDFGLRTISF